MSSRRIQREYDNLISDPPDFLEEIEIDAESGLNRWYICIVSPEESVYHGAKFVVIINFPSDYPYSTPTFVFHTKIFHPNITFKGDICKEALGLDKWTISSTIRMLIPSIRNLLLEPDVSNPLNPEAAVEYNKGIERYKEVIEKWLQTYNKD
jgi:ubiquitin-protein ligase